MKQMFKIYNDMPRDIEEGIQKKIDKGWDIKGFTQSITDNNFSVCVLYEKREACSCDVLERKLK